MDVVKGCEKGILGWPLGLLLTCLPTCTSCQASLLLGPRFPVPPPPPPSLLFVLSPCSFELLMALPRTIPLIDPSSHAWALQVTDCISRLTM